MCSSDLAPFVLKVATGGGVVIDSDYRTLASYRNPSIDAGVVEGELPVTGSNSLLIIEQAALFAVLGLGFILIARRRRRHTLAG